MKKKPRHFKGISVSPGIAMGFAHLVESAPINVPKFWISDHEVQAEIARFRAAVKKTQKELARLKEKICRFQIGDQMQIIDSHQMIAQDELLVEGTLKSIREEKINAEWAFQK